MGNKTGFLRLGHILPFRPLSILKCFPPNTIENLSSWTSEVVSQGLTKGMEGGKWQGGEEIVLHR